MTEFVITCGRLVVQCFSYEADLGSMDKLLDPDLIWFECVGRLLQRDSFMPWSDDGNIVTPEVPVSRYAYARLITQRKKGVPSERKKEGNWLVEFWETVQRAERWAVLIEGRMERSRRKTFQLA